MASYIQTASNSNVGGSAQTSLTAAFGLANNPGNLLVVTAGYFTASSPTFSISDTLGNTFTSVAGPSVWNSCHVQMWYAGQCRGGANTVTLTIASTGAPFPSIAAVEYTPGGVLDATATNSINGILNPFTSSTITASFPNEWIVDGCYSQTGNIPVVGVGYTSRFINPISVEDKLTSSAGSYNATWTGWANTGSENIINIIAGFRVLAVPDSMSLCGCGR